MPFRLSQRVRARRFHNKARQVIAPAKRHAPTRMRAVCPFPDRPRRLIAAIGAESFQLNIAFTVRPRQQVNLCAGNSCE